LWERHLSLFFLSSPLRGEAYIVIPSLPSLEGRGLRGG